ncbi:MAG: AbrB/MazE/SpoVT family DNA-binding domain-containing protein [Myxococcota bacterium]
MSTVTVSPKYQVVIPKEVRDELGIKPGELVNIFRYKGRIEFVPHRNIKEMRGFLKGMSSDIDRDEEDRL